MTIDNTTRAKYAAIYVDNDQKYLKQAFDLAVKEGLNEEENQLMFTTEEHTWLPQEFYYDESEGLVITGTLDSNAGEVFVSLTMPLSDAVLLDILNAGVKRLNKLKTVLEGLK